MSRSRFWPHNEGIEEGMIRRSDLVGTFRDRAEAWRTEALRFEEHQCVEVAATLRRVAKELEEDVREWGDELLTIEEASVESGYARVYTRLAAL